MNNTADINSDIISKNRHMRELIYEMVKNSGRLATQRVMNLQSQRNVIINQSNPENKSNSEIIKKFDELFNGSKISEPISIDSFLDRISRIEQLSNVVFLISGYLFYQIIITPEIFKNFKESSYSIKLFATCVYLAQKYHLDTQFHPNDMGKLLGLKPKSLNEKELFLYEKIFKFDLRISPKNLKRFKILLRGLPIRILQLEAGEQLSLVLKEKAQEE